MKSTIHRALAWIMLMLVGMQFAAAQMPVPEAGHRVTDLAQVLNVSDTENLARQLEDLETRTHAQVGILIVPTLQQEPIEAFSQRVFNNWGLGRAGVNDGMLMVLSVQDRKVRIHVGRGLDGTFPESVVTRIIRERMGPAFREKQYVTGFSRAIEAISGPIAEHSQVKSSSAELSNGPASSESVQPQVQAPVAQSSSSIGWAIGAIGAGVACIFFVVIGLQRQAKRKAREAAEQATARERDEMRRRASQASEDAYLAAQEKARIAAARAREERAAQNNAASARSTTSTRSASSYPSLRSVSSSASSPSGRTTSTSSSSRTSSSSSSSRPSLSKSSSSTSSSSSSRRSSSRDDDYSRRSAASWTPSVSSYESSSSSNSNSWSGGDSSGGGGSGDY